MRFKSQSIVFTLTLSLSKGERRPKAAEGDGGRSHVTSSC